MTAWISILSQYVVDAIEVTFGFSTSLCCSDVYHKISMVYDFMDNCQPLFIISDGKWVLRLGNTCFPPPPLSVLCCECLLVLMVIKSWFGTYEYMSHVYKQQKKGLGSMRITAALGLY